MEEFYCTLTFGGSLKEIFIFVNLQGPLEHFSKWCSHLSNPAAGGMSPKVAPQRINL